MCNERFNVTHNESKAISEFFVNNYIDFEPSECKRPCTQTTYDVHVNAIAEQNYLLMKLTFKSLIHVTRSLYTTTVLEAITSLGGSVRSLFCWNMDDNFQLTKQRNHNDITILESFIIGVLWCLWRDMVMLTGAQNIAKNLKHFIFTKQKSSQGKLSMLKVRRSILTIQKNMTATPHMVY